MLSKSEFSNSFSYPTIICGGFWELGYRPQIRSRRRARPLPWPRPPRKRLLPLPLARQPLQSPQHSRRPLRLHRLLELHGTHGALTIHYSVYVCSHGNAAPLPNSAGEQSKSAQGLKESGHARLFFLLSTCAHLLSLSLWVSGRRQGHGGRIEGGWWWKQSA